MASLQPQTQPLNLINGQYVYVPCSFLSVVYNLVYLHAQPNDKRHLSSELDSIVCLREGCTVYRMSDWLNQRLATIYGCPYCITDTEKLISMYYQILDVDMKGTWLEMKNE